MKKYGITAETLLFDGHELHRIVRTSDNRKGGWIEGESNLSQNGDCFVYDNAKVFGNAIIEGNATIESESVVCGEVVVRDNAVVTAHARIEGRAKIIGSAIVGAHAFIKDNAVISDKARVIGSCIVCGSAKICERATLTGHAMACGNALLCCDCYVNDYAVIGRDSNDTTVIGGHAFVHGFADIRGDAVIINDGDYVVFQNWWSERGFFTWTRSNDKWSTPEFFGTADELIKWAFCKSSANARQYERVVKYVDEIKDNTLMADFMSPRDHPKEF